MNIQSKIEIIDLFLPKLKEKGIGTLSEILDNSPKTPHSKIDIYRIIESDLEEFKLVHLLQGRDNSTIDGMCIYRISPKGIEFVINKKSVAGLYQNQNSANRVSNVDMQNLVKNKNPDISLREKKLGKLNITWTAIIAACTIFGFGFGTGIYYESILNRMDQNQLNQIHNNQIIEQQRTYEERIQELHHQNQLLEIENGKLKK